MEKEVKKEEGKGKERLVRLIFLGAGIFLAVTVVKNLAAGSGRSVSLPEISSGQIQPEKILGSVKGILSKEEKAEVEETEPIAEPVENVQSQTNNLIETIKKLPEDQLEAVKKQLYKEFCQDYCQQISESKMEEQEAD